MIEKVSILSILSPKLIGKYEYFLNRKFLDPSLTLASTEFEDNGALQLFDATMSSSSMLVRSKASSPHSSSPSLTVSLFRGKPK